MANYTTNEGFPYPALGDSDYVTTTATAWTSLDAVAAVGGLAVARKENPSASVNVKVSAGFFENGSGVRTTYSGTSSQALTANQTNYIYLTTSGVLTINTSGFPSTAMIPLATVIVGASTITTITDSRLAFRAVGSNLSYALLAGAAFTGAVSISTGGFTVTAGGITLTAGSLALADGNNITTGTSTGTTIATTTSQKLAFFGATPVIQPASANQAAWAAINTVTLTDSTGGSASTTLASATNTNAITDSTGGTGSTTFLAITAPAANATTSLTTDMTNVKNDLSQIATELNLQRALNTVLINAIASLAAQTNHSVTDFGNGRTLTNQLRSDGVTLGTIKGSA